MKGLIIYKGKYGATRQYAQWLGDELNLPVANANKFNTAQLANYDFLILGSAVYIGKILIKNWLKKNISTIQGKKLFLFVVSGTAPTKKDKLTVYVEECVPAEIRNTIEVFFLQGRMILKKISWTDRLILKIAALLAKTKEDKMEMKKEYDFVKKENIEELVMAVKIHYPAKVQISTDTKEKKTVFTK